MCERMKKLLLLFTCLSLFTAKAAAQNNLEVGSQAVTNYSPKEYNAQQQNWAITQDKRGIMYFGNSSSGLLEFDGNTWKIYQVPNKSTIRSLANDSSGKIYAGAKAELGYFLPDSTGRMTFHSLLKFIPKDKRDFSDVWSTYISNGKVYFNTRNYIFIWNIKKSEFKIIQPKNSFNTMFSVNGAIYTREWGIGLEVLKHDSLALVKGGEKFADERISVMLPFPGKGGTVLISTDKMGLFKYNGNDFIPFKTNTDKFFKEYSTYSSAVLSDGNILLGTQNGGAVVIDTSGRVVRKYNLESGIINNSINFAFQDRSGAIWLATQNGISRVDYSSPVSYFDSRNNFTSIPIDIIRHDGIIYAGTDNGIYSLDPKTSNFHPLKNSNTQGWVFLEMENELLVGTSDGLFKVETDRLIPVRKSKRNEYTITCLKQSGLNPDRIYAGTGSGLWSLSKNGNKWKDEGQILKVTDQPTSIVEDKDGRLWMSTFASGLFRVTFQKDDKGNIILNKPLIEHFDKKNGLQDGYTYIDKINGINYFVTTDSVYQFDENKKIFYSNFSDKFTSALYKIVDHDIANAGFQQDKLGRLWIWTKGKIAMGAPLPDGSWKWVSNPFNRLADDLIYKIYAEKNGVTWFTRASDIIKYDFGKKNSLSFDYPALVRSVEIGKDSTIFFGWKVNNPVTPEISFKNNSVKFRYSATSYEGKNVNKFKTFLDGFDDSWSQYSTETKKEYTNLPPGKYTFKVTALNPSGIESSMGTYSFEILSPWYRTWWAYIFYVLVLGFGIFTVDRTQRRRLVKKERERAHLRETELRAEAAESEAKALQAENERKKNVELLSEIGKEITATLDLDTIFYKLYEHVNQLADASIFGVGIYHSEKEEIEYRLAIEKGKRYPVYSRNTKDKNQFPVWCIENKKPVFINDVRNEYNRYIQNYKEPDRLLEDGTKAAEPLSIIYLPLILQDRLLGVITIQSFHKNAYTDYHLNVLQNLASYTSIALDNADAYDKLNDTVNKLNATLNDLKSTQEKLVTQEKLASLGALTAGIAHEIKNPLNFINNFSDVSNELLDELMVEIKNDNKKEIPEIVGNLKQNLEKITNHGKRADSIVKGMLLHSRGRAGEKALTDINDLLDQYAALAYHGMRALDKDFNISFEKDYDKTIEKINVVPQDISRVFLNIINNACYAAHDKKEKTENGFIPLIKISTKNLGDKVEVRIQDNGNGIPDDIKNELFNPFFTTKPSGEGTGLGLSISYDIVVKQHNGEIKVESKNGEGAKFIITLPKM